MARRRILLIKRASSERDALAGVLTSEGHDVRVADGLGADDSFAGFADGVVVCDVEALDDPSSVDLMGRTAATGSRLVLLVGKSAEASLRGAGAVVALAKPVNMEELRRVIREG